MGLDSVELVIAIEEKFAIAISDSEAEGIRTPRMMIEVVSQKLNPAMPRSEIAETVKKVIIDTLGIRERDYHEDADFIKDFNID